MLERPEWMSSVRFILDGKSAFGFEPSAEHFVVDAKGDDVVLGNYSVGSCPGSRSGPGVLIVLVAGLPEVSRVRCVVLFCTFPATEIAFLIR